MDQETNKLLSEILKWQRLQGLNTLQAVVPKLLDSEEKKIVYEMTDGKNGIKEVQARIKVATGTVHKWWNQWLASGIITKDGVKYSKIVSLKELGIEIPEDKDEVKEGAIENDDQQPANQ